MRVAVLCAMPGSVYNTLGGLDVYDKIRDARTFTGRSPAVAHPPCRGWGRLRHFAKPAPGELDLGPFCVEKIRQNGGVLEHPTGSKLWEAARLPRPGEHPDTFGGFTIQVNQFWWGHKAAKSTWLYIVGLDRSEVPPSPLKFGEPEFVVGRSRWHEGGRPEIRKSEREATPIEFARFLIEIAVLSGRGRVAA